MYPALSKVKENHPELCEMTTKTYRRYFLSLKSQEERAEAKRLRALQVQAKDNIINGFYKDQKQARKKNLKHNAVLQYSQGTVPAVQAAARAFSSFPDYLVCSPFLLALASMLQVF